MSPFRKIDWRCSCRFRGKFSPVFDSFLSVHRAGVTTLLPIPLRTSIGRDRELRTFLHRSFLFSRRRGRAKSNLRVRVVNHAVRINSLDVPAVRRFELRRQTPRNSAFGSIGRRLSPDARFSSLLPSSTSGKTQNSELGWKKV